jgi:hypothetical protein
VNCGSNVATIVGVQGKSRSVAARLFAKPIAVRSKFTTVKSFTRALALNGVHKRKTSTMSSVNNTRLLDLLTESQKEIEKLKEENKDLKRDISKIQEDVAKLYELLEDHLNVTENTCPGCSIDINISSYNDWETCRNCSRKICENCIVRDRNNTGWAWSPSNDKCKLCV